MKIEEQLEQDEILDKFRPPYPYLEIIRTTTAKAQVKVDYKELLPYLQTYKKDITTEEAYLSIMINTYKFMSYKNDYNKIYDEIDSLTDIFLDFLQIFAQDENFIYEPVKQNIPQDIAKRLVSNIPMSETFSRFVLDLTPVMTNTAKEEVVVKTYKGTYNLSNEKQRPNPYNLDLTDKNTLLISIVQLFLVEALFGIHNATARQRREFYPDSIISKFNETLRDKLKDIALEK